MIRFLPISLLVTTAIMALATPAANAAIYMTIDGVKGTVNSQSHGGQILIESWSLEASRAAAGGTGKVHYSDLVVMIGLEKPTPVLNLATVAGKHIDAMELTFRAPASQARGGEQQDYYKVTLEDVMVSGYQTSAKEFGFSINYARITHGTGKTMAAEVLASGLDGSVR